jgi:CBS-domain-containing membrane protein
MELASSTAREVRAMRVKEIMSSQRISTVRPEDHLALAAQLMLWAGVRHLPVVDGQAVVGVLTQRDILRHNAERGPRVAAKDAVRAAMKAPALTVGPDEPVVGAVALMLDRHVGCLPVLDGATLVGILTRSDLLRFQLESAIESPAERLARTPPERDEPTVAAVMRREPITIPVHAPLFEGIALMAEHRVRHIPVVDERRRVVGMLSDRDVRAAVGDPIEAMHLELPELESLSASTVMSLEPVTIGASASLSEACRHLIDDRVGALPVLDEEGRLVGIVSYVDVLRFLESGFRRRWRRRP